MTQLSDLDLLELVELLEPICDEKDDPLLNRLRFRALAKQLQKEIGPIAEAAAGCAGKEDASPEMVELSLALKDTQHELNRFLKPK